MSAGGGVGVGGIALSAASAATPVAAGEGVGFGFDPLHAAASPPMTRVMASVRVAMLRRAECIGLSLWGHVLTGFGLNGTFEIKRAAIALVLA
jgi:hypothetical protein